jgi:hypothetical protein
MQSIERVLSDEKLIDALKDSRQTAEGISANLRKLEITNTQLDKCRVSFTPVAYRAATLYFGIQQLS